MRSLADAACELPWLAPSAGSLVALTRGPSSAPWPLLRADPGLVLLLMRQTKQWGSASSLSFYPSLLRDGGVLELALQALGQPEPAFVNWHQPRHLPLYRAAVACATAAEAIAQRTDRCDAQHAWVGGLLAPLGWLAVAAKKADTESGSSCSIHQSKSNVHRLQLDETAIARRLAASWRLPAWLSAVVGHLGLALDTARALGADPDHYLVVQLAVTLTQEAGAGWHQAVGTPREELAAALELAPAALQAIVDTLKETLATVTPPQDWQAPAGVSLLPELLRLALENRRLAQVSECDRLHNEVDALHNAALRQRAGEGQRLQESKLRALAELAAGAGHEINNPLAVISGQAQYLLISEQEPPRRKALQTIVGQTQRIHQTLTQLMQFARPPLPQKQRVDLGGLVSEVAGSLQALADERQVRLTCAEPPAALTLLVDPVQIRTALSGLLKNAIEAAPANGWASLEVVCTARDGVTMIVEDSGPGPSSADREHLFDPFYSGRKAGRGRGLGLPAAWQLARQHGGEVRFDSASTTATRFVLTLPPEALVDTLPLLPERNGTSANHPVAQSA